MPAGVVAQAPAGLGGQSRAADRVRQLDDVLGGEAAEADAVQQVVLRQPAFPPGRFGRCVVACRDHDEDLVAAQPPPDEHERPAGGVVDPLGVVDHDDGRSGIRQAAEHGQQFRTHRQRVRVRSGARAEQRPAQPAGHVRDQLVQHPERDAGLALLPAAPQHARVGPVAEEPADQ